MRYTYPEQAQEILVGLLEEIENENVLRNKLVELEANIHFQLAVIYEYPPKKAEHLKACLSLKPDYHVDPRVFAELKREAFHDCTNSG